MNNPPARESIVLGVDGGATKTVCVVIDGAHRRLGEGRSGSSNRHSVGDELARTNLGTAIHAALDDAGVAKRAVSAICVGMAGVDRPPERAAIAAWLNDWLPGVCTMIENDAIVALASGTGGRLFGVVVISGTGMIVYGVNARGERRRAGGWGALLDAHGSGYAMGLDALRAIARAADGIDPPTALTAAILGRLGLHQPQELIAWCYADLAWARIADLSPVVVACADQGDDVAHGIVAATLDALSNAVAPVVAGLGLTTESFPLVLAGGNLQAPSLRTGLTARLHQAAPHAKIVTPKVEPAVGAALCALHSTAALV